MFPALLGYHGVLLLGLWSRRLPLRLTGLLLFLGPVTVVFSRLLLWTFGVLPDVGNSADQQRHDRHNQAVEDALHHAPSVGAGQ